MPVFIAALIGGLAQAAGSLVGRVLIALGIGFVTYTGFSAAVSVIDSLILSNINGLPLVIKQILGMAKIDTAIKMIMSAYSIRWAMSGLKNGNVTKMVSK